MATQEQTEPEASVRPIADKLEALAKSLLARVRDRDDTRLGALADAFRQTETAGSADEWLGAMLVHPVCVYLQKDSPGAFLVVAEIGEVITATYSGRARKVAVDLVADSLHHR